MTMETEEILIEKVIKSRRIDELIDVNNFKEEYRKLFKRIHPDICKHPKASIASSKLLELKDKFENGVTLKDESGNFNYKGMDTVYSGDFDFLKTSYANYNKLMGFYDKASENFKKYLPKTMSFSGNTLNVKYNHRCLPLTGLTLPQEHVNWIFSRMLEYAAWMEQQGYAHCGINPESIFVIPENHGIQVSSFYMMTKLGTKPEGISGMYQTWYPPKLFSTKKADASIDVELCTKTAIYLLGDKSGTGIKLKKDASINQPILEFLIASHDSSLTAFKEYRELLGKHFAKRFIPLDL